MPDRLPPEFPPEFPREFATEQVPRPRAQRGEADEAPVVRPYTVTGGRTRPSSTAAGGWLVPIEALVESLGLAHLRAAASSSQAWPPTAGGPEKRAILSLLEGRYLSLAEISAHLRLPVGVARVLVCDLSDDGAVRVHGVTERVPSGDLTALAGPREAYQLSILERVLDGIAAL